MAEATERRTKKEAIEVVKKELTAHIQETRCHPIVVRLAWHDAGSYDKDKTEWPWRGGANGSVRFYPEIGHAANAGLEGGVKLLKGIADKHGDMTYADIFQLASAIAVKDAGGPSIPLRVGRKDAPGPESEQPEGNLPAGGAPWPNGEPGPGDHLRKVFYRMGLNDQEIVALSGAHTLGRAYPHRSGFGKDSTKYTKDGPGTKDGTKGGSSWTPEWLKFDNSYYKYAKEQYDPDLLVLETDDVLFRDDGFRPYAEKYAGDQDAFFADYAKAHAKLSELGADWDPEPMPVSI